MAGDQVMELLGVRDSQPVIAERLGSSAPFVFICDHAGRETPAALKDLGLPKAAFDLHIAWDIGAADVTRRLGAAFEATCILQRYSRLVIDCNRDPLSAGAIPHTSDGVLIPANQNLDAAARQARIDEIHEPYHAAISAELDARRDRSPRTILVFVHSFTPTLSGVDRPWRFGVVREPTSRFSEIALELLQTAGDFAVGDNLPYAMDGTDYSAPTHALARGLDYLELEMRQDTVTDVASQAATVNILCDVLTRASARL